MHYLDVSLELPKSPNRKISPVFLKKNILDAVKQLLGEEGVKTRIDILKYDPVKCRFIIRCESNFYVKLRAALTVASQYETEPCVYICHRASTNLLSFVADSRSYTHKG